jgi:serine/threonine protein kinase
MPISKEAKELIKQCLEKDPNKRATINEVKSLDYFRDIEFSSLFISEAPRKNFTDSKSAFDEGSSLDYVRQDLKNANAVAERFEMLKKTVSDFTRSLGYSGVPSIETSEEKGYAFVKCYNCMRKIKCQFWRSVSIKNYKSHVTACIARN